MIHRPNICFFGVAGGGPGFNRSMRDTCALRSSQQRRDTLLPQQAAAVPSDLEAYVNATHWPNSDVPLPEHLVDLAKPQRDSTTAWFSLPLPPSSPLNCGLFVSEHDQLAALFDFTTFDTQFGRDCFVVLARIKPWVLLPFPPLLLLCAVEYIFDWPKMNELSVSVAVIYFLAFFSAAVGWGVMWAGVHLWRMLRIKHFHADLSGMPTAYRAAKLHAHVLVLSLLRAVDEHDPHSMHALHESGCSGCCSWRGNRRRVVGWVCVPVKMMGDEDVVIRHMHRVYADGSRDDAEYSGDAD